MQAHLSVIDADGVLLPLSQMRSANKKHGNIGDVEVAQGGRITESWDGKYGKTYLFDELNELDDKLKLHPGAEVAGFITDGPPLMRDEVRDLIGSVELSTGTEVLIMGFDTWVQYKTEGLTEGELAALGNEWMVALVESLCQKRRAIAPIDEPCDVWVKELSLLVKKSGTGVKGGVDL